MNHKVCKRCQINQPICEYYKHSQMGDGHLNICKSCKRKDAQQSVQKKQQDPAWREKENKRHRLKQKRCQKEFPEKIQARNKSRPLRKKYPNKELHHWCYLPEYYTDIFALSKKDHTKIHIEMQYDSKHKMFRSCINNELIDTREKARLFYIQILKKNID